MERIRVRMLQGAKKTPGGMVAGGERAG